jgi:hypothetical protein
MLKVCGILQKTKVNSFPKKAIGAAGTIKVTTGVVVKGK